MSDEWMRTTLGGTCDLVSEKVDPSTAGAATPYVGLEHIEPGVGRISTWGVVAAVTSLVARFQVGDVLFGRLRPYLRKVALAESEGVCSPEVLVLRARPDIILPGYLHLICSSEQAIEHAVAMSAGSRMPRTSPADLASFEFVVPPLSVQRRIVDLMAHLDNHIANLRAEQAAATQVLSRLRAEVYGSGADRIRLGDLARVDRGASWSAKQEIEEGGHPVIRIANVQPEGLDLSEVRRVEGLKPRDVARSSIGEGSILLVGSNGNPDRIGNAYLSDPALDGAVLASFLIGVHTESRDEAEFIWHCLCAPEAQAAITASTAGSTGLKNLSIEWLRDLGIPQPDTDGRQAALALLRAANSVVIGLGAEVASLTLIRGTLLESLLNGQARISEAYDDFLPKVA